MSCNDAARPSVCFFIRCCCALVDLSEFIDDVVHSESEDEVGEFDEDSKDSTDSELICVIGVIFYKLLELYVLLELFL